jgi:hypothetical protein
VRYVELMAPLHSRHRLDHRVPPQQKPSLTNPIQACGLKYGKAVKPAFLLNARRARTRLADGSETRDRFEIR